MTREDFDTHEALNPDTWQNRQGRGNEWEKPSTQERRGVPGGGIVRAVGIVAAMAFLANVAAQAWRAV